MIPIRLDLNRCPVELRGAISDVVADYPSRFRSQGKALTLRFEKISGPAGESLDLEGKNAAVIRYARVCDAFRGLGRLMGDMASNAPARPFEEKPAFVLMGAMIDVSRNAVMQPDAIRAFLRRLALMGLNMAILYAEDTYEVPGEPFFGYLRGRYTQKEMRELDRYAAGLGIEMFPCIQALAHLEQIIQWPAYSHVADTSNVLLADNKATYELLDKMIAAASAPFRSKRIHLGMDEAHGIGTGNYKRIHGETDTFGILNRHLARVRDLCRRRGLKPMIWSDMYFRIGSKTHNYYDPKTVIPPAVVRRIPKDVQLVYWDYYHSDPGFYCDWIRRHRALGSEPLMAGGLWTWGHIWAALPYAFKVTSACLEACRKTGLKEVFMTIWGDDGNECDMFSSLPAFQFFAEMSYSAKPSEERLQRGFLGSCNAHYDDWVRASCVDYLSDVKGAKVSAANPGKWLLWQDPLLAIADPHISDKSAFVRHYARLAPELFKAARRTPESSRLFLPAYLAKALALKIDLREKLAKAYRAGDNKKMAEIARKRLPALMEAVEELWRCHRARWLANNKPFGLEVLESRYGALLIRLESLGLFIEDYLAGRIKSIPELEVKLERFSKQPATNLYFGHKRMLTPSTIK